jgi:TonB family protein
MKFPLLIITVALMAINPSVIAAEKVSIPKSAVAIYAPMPKYPLHAGLRREEGRGLFLSRVNVKSGLVKEVIIFTSTGHADLDAAAVIALKQWKFKPGATLSIKQVNPHSKDPLAAEDGVVKIPVTFTIR